jgi:hypothetical protein
LQRIAGKSVLWSDVQCRNRAPCQRRRLLPDVAGGSSVKIGRFVRRIEVGADRTGVRTWFVGRGLLPWDAQCPRGRQWRWHEFCHRDVLIVPWSSELTWKGLQTTAARGANPHPREPGTLSDGCAFEGSDTQAQCRPGPSSEVKCWDSCMENLLFHSANGLDPNCYLFCFGS